ncbi:MAG: patatin family protein [Prevotella sp.]|nr:patatin family protein [Prevotella sp.]
MKFGLVLEGGAMRGLFSAGILDVMMEEGIEFDGAVGVSAGAAFGVNFKSRQIGRPIRYNKRFARDWRYCSLRSWIMTGDLFGADFAYHDVPNLYDPFDNEAYAANPMEFHLVCTDVMTGEAVYKQVRQGGDVCYDWVRASASMPMVSKPVHLDGKWLLDGGVADSIPLAYFERQGFERNVVILTQPEGYQKKHNRLMPLLRVNLRHYHNMVKALDRRHLMYNEQLAYVRKREQEGKALVIRPTTALKIGHISHNPDEMQAVYEEGRKMGMERLQDIRDFLQKKA